MLHALLTAMEETVLTDPASDQATDQASDQVKQLLAAFYDDEALKTRELLDRLGLQHRPTFRRNYLHPALEGGWTGMTRPEAPSSPAQRYRLTPKGRKS